MRYLSNCRVISKANDVLIIGPCISCKQEQQIKVSQTSVIRHGMGEYIQDVLPQLTPGEREFLISGFCEPCFDRMFSEEM